MRWQTPSVVAMGESLRYTLFKNETLEGSSSILEGPLKIFLITKKNKLKNSFVNTLHKHTHNKLKADASYGALLSKKNT